MVLTVGPVEQGSYGILHSPVGPLLAIASSRGIQRLTFGQDVPPGVIHNPHHPLLVRLACQVAEYFAGCRKKFDVPMDMTGTPFQRRVWDLLQTIPYGETTSYGALARELGNPNKARAVGLANRANPVAILVPCHRVIGASGALTGFGGGLATKAFLLRLEEHVWQPDLFMHIESSEQGL